MSQLPAPSLIAELEVRHDEAMLSLAELERRIEAALVEFGGASPASSKAAKTGQKVGGSELKLHVPDEAAGDESKPAAA